MKRIPHPASDSSRRYEKTAFLCFALLALGVAHVASDAVFLCALYGVRNFRTQHLHFVDMRNGEPWHVSNRDEIASDIQPLHFVIAVCIWLVITLPGFALIRRLLPDKNGKVSDPVDSRVNSNPTISMFEERRVFVEKAHYLRNWAMGLMFGWVISMAALTLLAQSVGRLTFLLIPAVSLALLGCYIRLRERHFLEKMTTAACPVCGLAPMHFETAGEEKALHKFLVCDRCHIEWDFGRL